MKPQLIARDTEHCHFVAEVNGKATSKVFVYSKSDESVPVATECINLAKPKDRARLVAALPNEHHAEATAALLALSAEAVAETARRPEPEAIAEIDGNAAYAAAKTLPMLQDIPKAAADQLAKMGVAGEAAQIELLYLAITTRILSSPLRPVSLILKSISGSGKSFVSEQTLRLFPPRAFYFMTAMSERALVYDTEPLKHRMLVIAEATGMEGEVQALIIRSLLSEGRLVYPYVGKDENGTLVTRKAEREGPTGLILTTTRAVVHPENETRLLSLSVTETPEQTRKVFQATAQRVQASAEQNDPPELAAWHALQDWLTVAERRVEIPYVDALAQLIDNRAVRMRRDFTTILALISARAILHQSTRDRNDAGCIIATVDDYRVVADLTADLVSQGIQARVPEKARKAVEAVAKRCRIAPHATSQDVADALGGMEKSAVNKWVRNACNAGYLVNQETRPRQPAKLVLGDPMPDDGSALPTVEQLETELKKGRPERSTRSAERPDRSTEGRGTLNLTETATYASVPPFHADSGWLAPSLFSGQKHSSVDPPKTAWNRGTHPQPVDSTSVSVPRGGVERNDRSAERSGDDQPPQLEIVL